VGKGHNQKAQKTREKETKERRKTIFLSEKMFNSFIETKKLKTKNNDER